MSDHGDDFAACTGDLAEYFADTVTYTAYGAAGVEVSASVGAANKEVVQTKRGTEVVETRDCVIYSETITPKTNDTITIDSVEYAIESVPAARPAAGWSSVRLVRKLPAEIADESYRETRSRR